MRVSSFLWLCLISLADPPSSSSRPPSLHKTPDRWRGVLTQEHQPATSVWRVQGFIDPSPLCATLSPFFVYPSSLWHNRTRDRGLGTRPACLEVSCKYLLTTNYCLYKRHRGLWWANAQTKKLLEMRFSWGLAVFKLLSVRTTMASKTRLCYISY